MQSTHAALEFTFKFTELAKSWHESNYLVQVTTPTLNALKELKTKLDLIGLRYVAFYEPDIGNELTALCIEPDPLTQKLIKKLKLL